MMMKKALPIWLTVIIIGGGCGVKTSLTPPDVLVAKPINDLQGIVKEGAIALTWSCPQENQNGSKPVDLVSFRVLRREETKGCLECPGEFLVKADLDLRSNQGFLREDNTITWQDTDLKEGVIYIYKVISINHWGYPSLPSNEVVIKWGVPPAPPAPSSTEGRPVE